MVVVKLKVLVMLNRVRLTGTESLQDVQSILIALESRSEEISPYDAIEVIYPVLSLCADPEAPALEQLHMELVYRYGFTDCEENELTLLI